MWGGRRAVGSSQGVVQSKNRRSPWPGQAQQAVEESAGPAERAEGCQAVAQVEVAAQAVVQATFGWPRPTGGRRAMARP